MSSLIPLLVSLLGQVVPLIGGNSSLISTVIQALVQLVPLLTQEFKDLLPIVQGIIADLKGNAAVTPDDMATLDALNAQVDAAFDAAAAAATAEDAAS